MDAGCASSIEAIESGEAHAPELAHVATHEFTLGACGPSALAIAAKAIVRAQRVRNHQRFPVTMLGNESPVRAALGLLKGPIATAGDRIGLLVSTWASIARVAKICRQPKCDGGSGWPSKASA